MQIEFKDLSGGLIYNTSGNTLSYKYSSYPYSENIMYIGSHNALSEIFSKLESKVIWAHNKNWTRFQDSEFFIIDLGKKVLVYPLKNEAKVVKAKRFKDSVEKLKNTSFVSLQTNEGILFVDTENASIKYDFETNFSDLNGAEIIVGSQGEIEKRITATRLLTVGVFAFAFKKKKDNRELFLIIQGPNVNIQVQLQPSQRIEAESFSKKSKLLSVL